MIGDKTEHFESKGKDPGAVQQHVEEYLKGDGFTVQSSPASDQGVVIQARKQSFLRGLVDADRALTIHISGSADDLEVHIGIGNWVRNLAVAAVETLLISDLFLFIDLADSAWNLEIEDRLVKDLRAFMG
jgi:hypothetical protein